MNWKLTLSYDGSTFHGWQVQPNLPTVQGTLASTLHHLTGESVLPQGSGRTDAGVHALAQVASFTLKAAIPAENLLRALNRALPTSIRVLCAEQVPDAFHARHSARSKTYEYRIFQRRPRGETTDRICPPFLAPYVWDCRWSLDVAPMQEAAALLLGTHDFSSFAASDPDLSQRVSEPGGPNPVKTVTESAFTVEGDLLVYSISGSGFLHHMVRNLVGTFADVGRGALVAQDIPAILAKKDRSAAGPTAPASGLFLRHVDYGPGAAQ